MKREVEMGIATLFLVLMLIAGTFVLHQYGQAVENRVWSKQPKKWMVWVDTDGKSRDQIALELLNLIEVGHNSGAIQKRYGRLEVYLYDPYTGGER